MVPMHFTKLLQFHPLWIYWNKCTNNIKKIGCTGASVPWVEPLSQCIVVLRETNLFLLSFIDQSFKLYNSNDHNESNITVLFKV